MTDAVNRELIKRLQGSLPLTENPYASLARELGISESEVVGCLRQLKTEGRLKRIGAVLRHQKSGFTENAMAVFRVDENLLEQVAEELTRSALVSHCYQRTAYAEWPYNLYAMMHSRNTGEIAAFVESLTARYRLPVFAILPSETELKKTSMVYD